MQLISTYDVVKAANLHKFGGENLAKIIMGALQIDKINQIYANHYSKQTIPFLNAILKDTGISYEINDLYLSKIPKEGPFIIIANHPFGGIEGLILLNSILDIRPDFKIIANFLFQRIEPIKEVVFPVNPFETHQHVKSSYNGLRQGLEHLSNGHPLGIFPAGEVSAYQKDTPGITDRPWSNSIMKFIKNANVSVIPLYFHGKNSPVFYFMGRIHPLLRTVKIPSEMLNKKNVKIKLRIGNPISIKEQSTFSDIKYYGQYLRSKTYALATISDLIPEVKKPEEIIGPNDKALLCKEINQISTKYLMFHWQEYSVFCAPTCSIPMITAEIGRLREITFREVGEGTNQSTDLDKFDRYYHQLFIWNATENEIVGGYRIGKGFEILPELGKKGFYINSLFRIGNKMETILSQSVELGRSFIVKKYQRKPWPLFLLWKGIFHFIQLNKQCRYLIGPVSISNRYSNMSKQLMVEYIKMHHYNDTLSLSLSPIHPYIYSHKEKEINLLLDNIPNLNALDRLLNELFGSEARMPVLLKKYLLLGGKIAGFNLDPSFNDCLDCLLILDLKQVPDNVFQALAKEKTDRMEPELC